ncbi:T9SS type A sorting domain-containing protein [Flavobacteriaceae bacterium SZ-1-7]|uniref:T9SS type A sorting domain-containing protein n=1 Tax=Tamlana sedimenti TaxID=3134126 RepID=UPI003127A688
MKQTLLKNAILTLALVFAFNSVNAQLGTSEKWTGAEDTNFSNGLNWEFFSVPVYDSANSIYTRCDIDTANPCILNDATIDTLGTYVVRPGASFTIQSSVVFARSPYSSPDHYLGGANVSIENGAVVNVRRSAWIGSSSTGAPAFYTINAGCEFRVANNFSVSERQNATIDINGGTLVVESATLRLGAYPQFSSYGIINLNSGNINAYDISINGDFGSKLNVDEGVLTIPAVDYRFQLQSLVDGGLIVPAAGKAIVIEFDGTDTILYASATASVDDISSRVSTNVKAIGNRILVSNVTLPSEVNIYSITGALVKSFKVNADESFEFRSGLYVGTVKTSEGQKSFKLLLK